MKHKNLDEFLGISFNEGNEFGVYFEACSRGNLEVTIFNQMQLFDDFKISLKKFQ